MPPIFNPPAPKSKNVQAPAPAPAKTENASVTQLLTRIIALIDELVALMDKENVLIEERRLAEHAELLKVKQRLTLDYRASLKAIVLDPSLLKNVPEELRVKAKHAAERLAESSGRNARTLRAVMTACQRLVQSIISIVKGEVLPTSGYGNMQAGHIANRYSPTCKPVTVYKSA
jgi:hypothetical protein